MLVKKYEAKDMQQAMDDIVKELGSTAVILNSRKIRKKGLVSLFAKPLVEVMVAYEPRRYSENLRKAPAALRGVAREAYAPYTGAAKNTEPAYFPQSAQAKAHSLPAPIMPPPQPRFNTVPSSAAVLDAVPESVSLSPATITKLHNIDDRIDSLDHVLSDFITRFNHIKRDITYDFSPEVEKLVFTLCENQVREELALSLARETEAVLKARKDAKAYDVIYQLVLDNLGVPAPIATKKYKQKVILFLGPTGVGKTTSLVKLASAFVINNKNKVGIINTDTYRIAAHEQLRTYADILDIPLGLAYRIPEVEISLNDMSDCDLIFIDTAGKRPGDPQHQEDISQIISCAKPDEIFLCIAAPTCFTAIREVVDTYAFTGDFKLIITKLDETRYHGMVLNTVNYAKKPLAYVTIGQNVPDDLEIADCESLAQQMLEL
ncbi:MAG: flagellar biosynthesis protein FlhF [Firmicutes bacterium]|nr:flagellar biosynthesis protein FlhF [Bacillota bacterium]